MIGWRELLILLVIVLLIFGAKRLRNIGEDLGGAVKGFKEGVKGADEPAAAAGDAPQEAQQIPGKTIDAEVKKETNRS